MAERGLVLANTPCVCVKHNSQLEVVLSEICLIKGAALAVCRIRIQDVKKFVTDPDPG